MMRAFKQSYFILSILRLLPHWLFFNMHPNSSIIKCDLITWMNANKINMEPQFGFLYLMTFYPEYRNLCYFRVGGIYRLLNIFCPKMDTLFISTKNIGTGLFIQHGFSTIIAAKSIGKNCWINQQVTIGYSNDNDCPIIMDNVSINAGAKVIGKVTVGENSIIGANAVVVKNVPSNCTVVGVPAYIVKRDGRKVKELL